MADNFGFDEGVSKTGAAKDIGGVLYAEVIAVEADGTATGIAAKLGSLTETAPATDTASSGTNGRLQRIAQRLTTLISSTIAVSGTFWQALQPVSIADGGSVTLGSKADAKSTATDTTAITAMQVWKQISASVQAIVTALAGTLTVATHAVTQSGTWTVQIGNTPNTTAIKVDGSAVTQPVSIASVPSHAVTNAGTFATQDSEKIADDAAFGVASTKVLPVGFLADETATDSVDEGDVGAARMTLDRKQHVVAELESSSMRAAGTALTPKFATIAASSSGATTIVAAVTSKKIRVVALQYVCNAAVNVKFQSHVTPTDKTGLAYNGANGGIVLPYNPVGWFETVAGEALDINLSGAVAVGGSLTYLEI